MPEPPRSDRHYVRQTARCSARPSSQPHSPIWATGVISISHCVQAEAISQSIKARCFGVDDFADTEEMLFGSFDELRTSMFPGIRIDHRSEAKSWLLIQQLVSQTCASAVPVDAQKIDQIGEAVDRLISVDLSARGFVSLLYDEARKINRDRPLCLTAARGLIHAARPQHPIIIATGLSIRGWFSPAMAESDGPIGAVPMLIGLIVVLLLVAYVPWL